ncbi:glycosyltransferase family protein [Nocardia sp. NPDC003345]
MPNQPPGDVSDSPSRFAVTIAPPASYEHREAFREVAETVDIALRRLGHDSVLTDELRVPGRRSIVFGSNTLSWWGLEVPADAVLFNLEQIAPGSQWVTEELLGLFRRHTVWDYSLRNIAALRELGVPDVRHVPIGHVPELERVPPAAEQDIDVLVIGSLNEHRLAPIERLRGLGVNAQAHFGVYGAARDALYGRAKIILNTHYYDTKIFEIVRVSYLLANGFFVVSEDCADTEEAAPFAPAVAFTGYDRVVRTCLHYLDAPGERAARAAAGREIMRARPATAYLAAALGDLDRRVPGRRPPAPPIIR